MRIILYAEIDMDERKIGEIDEKMIEKKTNHVYKGKKIVFVRQR
jgi:hypothetical protein